MNLNKVIELFMLKINFDDFEIVEESDVLYALTDLEINSFNEVIGVRIILTEHTAAIQFGFDKVLENEKTLKILNKFNQEGSNVYTATIEDPDVGYNVLYLTSFFITKFLANEEDYAESLRTYFEDFGMNLIISEMEQLLNNLR